MMPKLPKPDLDFRNPFTGTQVITYSRKAVRAIQEEAYRAGMQQAYENALNDAWQKITDSFPKSEDFAELRNGMILSTNLITAMLSAVKEVK